jgi:hypothetical protein
LKDLVLFGIVPHAVVSHLLSQSIFVGLQEGSDGTETHFFFIKLPLQVIGLRELVLHIILHLANFLGGLSHFFVDSTFQIFHFLEIVVDSFLLNS